MDYTILRNFGTVGIRPKFMKIALKVEQDQKGGGGGIENTTRITSLSRKTCVWGGGGNPPCHFGVHLHLLSFVSYNSKRDLKVMIYIIHEIRY